MVGLLEILKGIPLQIAVLLLVAGFVAVAFGAKTKFDWMVIASGVVGGSSLLAQVL